jgi:hypothetical protein
MTLPTPTAVVFVEPDGTRHEVPWGAWTMLVANQPPPEKPDSREPKPDSLKDVFLRELADGPRLVSDLQPILMQRWNIDWIKQVRKDIGITSRRVGGREWEWSLPER